MLTVPGALEIPAPSRWSESALYDGYVAIGVVIRGETYHFEIVAGESARGIMALTMDGMAIGSGILTVENEDRRWSARIRRRRTRAVKRRRPRWRC